MTLDRDGAVAGLTGPAWLEWLDSRWDRSAFSAARGATLLTAPYQSPNGLSVDDALALVALGKGWVSQQKVGGS